MKRFLFILPLIFATVACAQKKINASNVTAGTIPDAQLSSNVLLKAEAYSTHTTSPINSSSAPTTVITVSSARHIEFLSVSCLGAGTRPIQISTTNAVAGGILYLRLSFTGPSNGAVLALESGTSSPTELTTYTTSTATSGPGSPARAISV